MPIYVAEWVLPSLNFSVKFTVKDVRSFLLYSLFEILSFLTASIMFHIYSFFSHFFFIHIALQAGIFMVAWSTCATTWNSLSFCCMASLCTSFWNIISSYLIWDVCVHLTSFLISFGLFRSSWSLNNWLIKTLGCNYFSLSY